jgi:hypothetical protein
MACRFTDVGQHIRTLSVTEIYREMKVNVE